MKYEKLSSSIVEMAEKIQIPDTRPILIKFDKLSHLCLNNTEKGTGLYQINAIGFPFIQEITVKIMFYNERKNCHQSILYVMLHVNRLLFNMYHV